MLRLRAPRHMGKNAIIVMALVGVGFFVAWVRFRPYLGSEGRYTDGVNSYEVTSPGEVRYAVWDKPVPFPGELNGPEAEGRASLAPDGRVVVFAVGERGLGADLWYAQLIEGEAKDAKPLTALNTAADELAPVFAQGALYFASDRAGGVGGLDLWRARYDRGRFEAPERLEGGINSSADDTDPAPLPGSESLVFASNRAGRGPLEDFDLFLAQTVRVPEAPVEAEGAEDTTPEGGWRVEALEALNSGYQEREPAFTADGSALFFASDRTGGAGGFDLYRSTIGIEATQLADRWLAPEPVVGLNGPAEERAPSPAPDGFSLIYSAGEAGGAPDLVRARSLELFRAPGKPVGWRELLVVLALIAIALLAWLAKRWEQLEIVYKCFLISALVHLFLMFYFREVYPESPEYELRGGDDDRVRVRLVADASAAAANAERGGELESLQRAAQEAREAQAAPTRAASAEAMATSSNLAPSATTFEREAAPSAAAPTRADAVLERALAASATANAPEMVAPTEAMELRSGAAPRLALDASRAEASLDTSSRQATGQATELERAASAASSDNETLPAPSAARVERGEDTGAFANAIPARTAVGVRVAPQEAGEARASDLRAPTEAFERRSQGIGTEAQRMLQPQTDGVALAPSERAESALERASGSSEGALQEASSELRPGALALERSEPSGNDVPDVVRPASALVTGEFAAPRDDARPEVDVQGPANEGEAILRGPENDAVAASLDPTPTSGRSEPTRPLELDAQRFDRPQRELSAQASLPTPRSFQVERTRPSRSDTPQAPRRLTRSEVAPSVRRAEASASLPDLKTSFEGAEILATLDAAETVAEWQPTLTTSDSAQPRRERGASAGPQRLRSRSQLTSKEIELAPLAVAEPREEDRSRERQRWDHTPYQSRSGENKIRALALHGGTEETERAVASGLDYLAGIQKFEGYWGSARDRHEKYGHVVIGKTGLALLAFLGAGHTTESDSKHAATVGRAIDFLLAVQDEETGHFGYCSSYGHGIATYSLAEAYALTRDERLRPALESAVAQILRNQKRSGDERFSGGWSYYYPDDRTFDRWPRASITAWQVMALESARLGGIDVPDRAFRQAKEFLENAWDEGRGSFRYSHDPSRLRSDYATLPGSTPASLFALSLMGEDISTRPWRDARRFLLERQPSGYRWRGSDAFVLEAKANLYFWYYGTLALFRVQGEDWNEWNVAMQETLLPAQEENGSWAPISIYARDYAQDKDGDRTYSTAMSVLTLEIYYRYFTPLLEVQVR